MSVASAPEQNRPGAEALACDVALDHGSYYVTARGTRFATVAPTTREYGLARRNAFTQPRLEVTLRGGLERFPEIVAFFEYACEAVEAANTSVRLQLAGAGGRTSRSGRATSSAATAPAARCASGSAARSAARPTTSAGSSSTSTRERQTRVVCDPARPFLTLPGPGGIQRFEFMLHDDETDAIADDPAFVAGLLAAGGPNADAPIMRRQAYTFHACLATPASRIAGRPGASFSPATRPTCRPRSRDRE